MSRLKLTLKKLSFISANKDPASIKFYPGVNVVCGASDTGKTFLIEVIDFMLGGTTALRDLPERVGFDRVRISLEDGENNAYTLERAAEGGGFGLYDGVLDDVIQTTGVTPLKAKHKHSTEDNVSGWLLARIGLLGKSLRKNKLGVTRSLSFRDMARLVVIDENEIIRSSSPFLSGQVITKTAEYSALKLLLTGADDSAIVASEVQEKRLIGVAAKVEVIGQLITELTNEISAQNLVEAELIDQADKLALAICENKDEMEIFQGDLNALVADREVLLEDVKEIKNRTTEINGMLERFDLLKEHYLIDIDRLVGVEETGSLFVHYKEVSCPLCGSKEHDGSDEIQCEGDVERIVFAAKKEIEKIELLMEDLNSTVSELEAEKTQSIPELEEANSRYQEVDDKVREAISPDFQENQIQYTRLMEKQSEVKLCVDLFSRLGSLQEKMDALIIPQESVEELKPTVLSKYALNQLSKIVENILIAWDFPNAEDIYFDEVARDFVIEGKPRGSRGKGLRAITHAAVTIGLMEFCRDNSLYHPGFVVLDSPLLAYYKPEGDDDSLIGSNLKESFYNYLIEHHSDSQIIIVENEHPPANIEENIHLTVFTKNPQEGRFGLLPH